MRESWHFKDRANRDKKFAQLKADGHNVFRYSGYSVLTGNFVDDFIVMPDGSFHPDIDRGLANLHCGAKYHIREE